MTENEERELKIIGKSTSEVEVKEVKTICVFEYGKMIFGPLILNPETGRYDYQGDSDLDSSILQYFVSEDNKGFIIDFGKVSGNFDCSYLNLTSLKGAPIKVGGSFYCTGNKLTSLEGAPREVGWDFYCYNNQLTSLKGAPQIVGGDFWCSRNKLISLEGAPQKVGGDFGCSDNQLTSLKGAPQTVGGDFHCTRNKLTSLEGIGEVRGRISKDF